MERELLLLGLLRQHEMHGYELHGFIERVMSTCVDLKKATAYFLLDKMTRAGWVSVSETREGKRPARKTYQLTAAGVAEFHRQLRDNLGGFNAAKTGDDVGLAFMDALEPAEVLALLTQRRARVSEQLAEYQHAPQHAGSLQLLIDHQVHYLKSELEWVNTVIHTVAHTVAHTVSNARPSTSSKKTIPKTTLRKPKSTQRK